MVRHRATNEADPPVADPPVNGPTVEVPRDLWGVLRGMLESQVQQTTLLREGIQTAQQTASATLEI